MVSNKQASEYGKAGELGYAGPFVKIDEISRVGNVRELNQAHIDWLAKNIKASGLLARPVLSDKTIDDKFEIIDGYHRVEAMIKLGWTHAPVSFVGKNVKLQSAKTISNIVRLDMPAMDIAREFKARCMEDGEISPDKVKALAAELGKSVSFVKDYLALTTLIGEFHPLLANKDSGFGIGHGLALAGLSKADQTKLFQVWKKVGAANIATLKSWAKNPTKAAQSVGLEEKIVESKAEKLTSEKPVHVGMLMQKMIATLEKENSMYVEMPAAIALALIEAMPELLKQMIENGGTTANVTITLE